MGKHSQTSISISAPSNGAKIEDVGAWGNKPLAAPSSKDKDHKKRSIWGFREKHSVDLAAIHPNDSNLSLTQQQYYEQIANVRPVFGMPLAEAVECCAPRLSDVCLPAVVYRCLEYLVAKGASKEEGIFRLSGSSLVIKGLRDRFNLEGDLDFLADDQYYDVHAVASLLKLYLRELPTSVLTRELHLDFLAVLCKLLVHPYLSFRD
jgi:RalA-binding protein 1